MGDHSLDLRPHGSAIAVGLVHALLGDQHHGLTDAGDEGWDGGDEAGAEQEIACTMQVGGGGEVGADGLWQAGREGVDDVHAEGEGEEGDGEVDDCWMDGLNPVLRSVLKMIRG